MALSKRVAVGAAAFVLAGILAYGELVRDWRTPSAEQPIRFVLAASTSLLMAEYNQLRTAMERKYGERVDVGVPVSGPPSPDMGIAKVSLDGQVLETHSLRRFDDVEGLFVIRPDDPDPIRFPIQLAPDQNLAALDHSLVDQLKSHFSRSPRAWFDFSDASWTIDRCASQKSGLGLGRVGDVLGLQAGTSCVVSWRGPRSSSMLVFVGRAEGQFWLRTISQRLCRSIVETSLQRLDEIPGDLEYATCVLGDPRSAPGAGKVLFGGVYAVLPNRRVARLRTF